MASRRASRRSNPADVIPFPVDRTRSAAGVAAENRAAADLVRIEVYIRIMHALKHRARPLSYEQHEDLGKACADFGKAFVRAVRATQEEETRPTLVWYTEARESENRFEKRANRPANSDVLFWYEEFRRNLADLFVRNGSLMPFGFYSVNPKPQAKGPFEFEGPREALWKFTQTFVREERSGKWST